MDILKELPHTRDPNVLVGKETLDDAGVYKLTNDIALIQTLDFFTPIVDDPFVFGQIAATNALSDVYAMGGTPLTAMNIVCFPKNDLPIDVLKSIILGGYDILNRAGVTLLGGHSVDDPEIKFGMSITGIIHPDKIITNSGAKPGDILILTKPIGSGILTTAIKANMLPEGPKSELIRWLTTLNKNACEAMQEVGVNACTDITGFGLIGHALEMATASNVTLEICASKVPLMPYTLEMLKMGMMPEGSYENLNYCKKSIHIQPGIDEDLLHCLFDAQTSGGLLISIPLNKAASLRERLLQKNCPYYEIGFVKDYNGKFIEILV